VLEGSAKSTFSAMASKSRPSRIVKRPGSLGPIRSQAAIARAASTGSVRYLSWSKSRVQACVRSAQHGRGRLKVVHDYWRHRSQHWPFMGRSHQIISNGSPVYRAESSQRPKRRARFAQPKTRCKRKFRCSEDQNVGGERLHVRQRLDGRPLVGHGAIDVTPRPRPAMACGPTGSQRWHGFVYQGIHWTRRFASRPRAHQRLANQKPAGGSQVAGFSTSGLSAPAECLRFFPPKLCLATPLCWAFESTSCGTAAWRLSLRYLMPKTHCSDLSQPSQQTCSRIWAWVQTAHVNHRILVS
jgi:hypothetical protein